MAVVAREITVKLAPVDAERIAEIAQHEGASVEAVAERLLHEMLEVPQLAPESLAEYFDSIPGFYERHQESLAQIHEGRTVPASDLRRE